MRPDHTLHWRHMPPGLLGIPHHRFCSFTVWGSPVCVWPKWSAQVGWWYFLERQIEGTQEWWFMVQGQPRRWKVFLDGVPRGFVLHPVLWKIFIISDFPMKATDPSWDDTKLKRMKSGQKQEISKRSHQPRLMEGHVIGRHGRSWD